MDEEKEYYSLVKRAFDRLAPFYDIVTSPISEERDEGVNFVKEDNRERLKTLCHCEERSDEAISIIAYSGF